MTDMARAYNLAALAVRQRLGEQHPERLDALDRLTEQDVVVYKGDHDSVQEVLRRLRVPFQLDPKAKRLHKARVAFANCTGNAHKVLRSEAEPFVAAGGWLVSTDWSLKSVVEPCFPGTIRHKQGHNSADEVVAVEPNLDSLWSDVVVLGADPQWWLEVSSYPIEVVDSERVRVEAASHELLVRYDAPVVSARFDWHDGHVYHVISHMWLKRTRMPRQPRYRGPCTDFLAAGMKLSEEGIAQVLGQAKLGADQVNFATLQSAATATELVARLCIEAVGPSVS
ncbi:MAG: hypothetical protein ACYTG0_17565 [Planctomycetota bacterium]|jgi:hypothetical protein